MNTCSVVYNKNKLYIRKYRMKLRERKWVAMGGNYLFTKKICWCETAAISTPLSEVEVEVVVVVRSENTLLCFIARMKHEHECCNSRTHTYYTYPTYLQLNNNNKKCGNIKILSLLACLLASAVVAVFISISRERQRRNEENCV